MTTEETQSVGKTPFVTFYDVQGMTFGVVMTSLGVVFLKAAGLITGQTAGLAILLSYVLSIDFGILFFIISAPFFWLAWTNKGAVFTIRTIIAVAGISAITPLISHYLVFASIPGLLAAMLGGACSGIGLIALFRHGSSAGGLGILALIVEKYTGFKTGWFQLCFDGGVFAISLFVLDFEQVLYSFIGAVILNAIIAWNFRIDQVGA